VLRGTKQYCSGARTCTHALITSEQAGSHHRYSSCGRCLADADQEADQPDHQDYERDPPQDVKDEAQPADDEGSSLRAAASRR